MDFELPEELAEVQKLARDFAEKEIAPAAAKDDREHDNRTDSLVTHWRVAHHGEKVLSRFAHRSATKRIFSRTSKTLLRRMSGEIARAVFKVLARHISQGEIDDVKHILPKALHELCRENDDSTKTLTVSGRMSSAE